MNPVSRSFFSDTRALVRRLALLPLLLLCLLPSLAGATGITLVQHRSKDGGTNTTASVAFQNPNTAGNFIAVAIRGGFSSSQVFTVKDSNGNLYKKAAQIGFTVSAVSSAVYYAENVKGGANTVTVSMTVSAPLRFAILEYAGVATSNSLDATATATGTGTAVNSGSATTTINGDLLFGSASTVDGASYTAGTGYTIRDSVPTGNGAKFITEDGIQTIAGTASATATLASSGNWGCVFAAFKPAGGVASPSISSLNPASGPVGTSVTIAGANFGASQGTSTVTFNGTAAFPTSWSTTSIVVPVPNGATTGNVVVTVGGLASNGASFTVILPPSITSLSPTFAFLGASVTITGSNLGASQGSSTVTFNGVAATPTSWSTTSITAPVPSGATTGNVVVTVGGLSSNGIFFRVAPFINSLSPMSGPIGTSMTITGNSFGATQGTSAVTLGASTVTPISWSDTVIIAPVPPGAITGNLIVMVNGVGSNRVVFTVTPAITSLNPTSGPVGTSVTVTGTSFGASQGTSTVTFNGTTAIPTSWSDTGIVVPVPSGATTGNVVVNVGGFASNGLSFTVTVPPSITSLNPTSGAAGVSVTIIGTNFGASQGTSTVTFNGTAATPTSWQAAAIAVPVPTGATTGNVVVTVGGLASNGILFTVPPPPAITSLNPTSGPVSTRVTIAGSDFGTTPGTSTITFNGTPGTISSADWTPTSVVALVPRGATSGNVVVTVGGLASNGLPFTVTVPPNIFAVSPVSGPVGTSVQIAGSNFGASQGTSTVTFNGTTASPTSWSDTQIVVPVPSGATTGNIVVTVGSLTASGGVFTVTPQPPSITSLTPAGGVVGTSVTITGSGFGPSQGNSTVTFNGTLGIPTSWSDTSIVAPVPSGATSGNVVVTVGGIASNGVTFNVAPPPPTPSITALSPSSAVAGSGPLTITVTGANFVSSSTVQWNGGALATTFLSGTRLQATVTSTNLASLGADKVTVSDAGVGGGVSNALTFFVGTTGGSNFATIVVNQAAQDIVYDPANQVFYLSVPGNAATNPNTIAILDPTTATITSTQPTGNNPNVLAISDDSQFLYAGIDGASTVQRFILPGLTPDISYPLGSNFFGPFFALDLQVAPGAPHTTAVSLGNSGTSPAAQGGVTIFDDVTPRATNAPGGSNLFGSIQWGADGTTLFASNTETSSYDFYTLTVSSGGVTLNQDFQSEFDLSGNFIHFDRSTNLVYSDDGQVINPATGLPVGNFNATRVMVADAALNAAFFANTNSSSEVTMASFDLSHFTPINSVTLANVTGQPGHLIRWGQNGLAFINNSFSGTKQIVLVGGDFVSAAPPFVLTPPPAPVLPPAPGPNAPTIGSLNPSSSVAGSAAFVLNVTGTQFDPAATVQFNGSALSTTYVSSTQLQALIPASAVASPGAASVVVSNPSVSGGNSGTATFFVGSTGGTSSAGAAFAVQVMNQAAKQIAFDAASQRFYFSAPNSAATGNTIAVLDPTTASIVGQQFAGSNPDAIAISDDGQYLYAGIDGSSSVQRFQLPGLATDISYSLGAGPYPSGPFFALDLQVAPGSPHTTAVTRGAFNSGPQAIGGIEIFDDALARPTIAKGFGSGGGGTALYDSLQWGADATVLFASNTEDSQLDFYTLSVTSSGVSQTTDTMNAFSSFRDKIHFDQGTQLIYADDGQVLNPSTGTLVGTFSIPGPPVMVPDSSLNLAFFAIQTGSSSIRIYSFNLNTFGPVDSITISNVNGNPVRLIRWGQNGLAFNTDAGQIVLVGGNFIH